MLPAAPLPPPRLAVSCELGQESLASPVDEEESELDDVSDPDDVDPDADEGEPADELLDAPDDDDPCDDAPLCPQPASVPNKETVATATMTVANPT